MNALAELRKRASTAAIPAIPAIRGGQRVPESRESQESREVKAEMRFLIRHRHACSMPYART